MSSETFTDGALIIDVALRGDDITVSWRGRGVQRDPTPFIQPILNEALDRGIREGRRVVMDFSHLEYLNSSSLSPVIHTLERATRTGCALSVVYDKDVTWQSLCFSALYLFQTPDGRVHVQGADRAS